MACLNWDNLRKFSTGAIYNPKETEQCSETSNYRNDFSNSPKRQNKRTVIKAEKGLWSMLTDLCAR